MDAAKSAGAKRAKALAVSIAAHSPLMDSIQSEWNDAVDACAIKDADIPVIGNVHANQIVSADDLRADISSDGDVHEAGHRLCHRIDARPMTIRP